MNSFFKLLKNIFDLHEDKEQEHITIDTIKRNISFRGTRLWILIFAIFIASIGLNVNSTAVIIGAMLISPLMGPIVGTGLALAINDLPLLNKSLFNLFVASFIGFLVSAVYFFLSPISEAQSEILARTSPNIYDVLIAFFGGLAGIVGSSRKDKGLLLPGVAIATALMPPLCTAGYGLATGQTKYLFGALYLYFINCTFIATATFVMVKYLKFETVHYVNPRVERRVKTSFYMVSFFMLLPALYFGFKTAEEVDFRRSVNAFIADNFEKHGYTIIYRKRNPTTLELAFLDQRFSKAQIDSLQSLMPKYGLTDYYLNIKQDISEFTSQEWNMLLENLNNRDQRLKTIEEKMNVGNAQPVDSSAKIGAELRLFYPGVQKVLLGSTRSKDTTSVIAIVYRDVSQRRFTNREQVEIPLWLKTRLAKDSVAVFFN